MMRRGGVLLMFLLIGWTSADAFTVILQNGRTMEGALLSEESESIRFRDIYGIEYSLKKAVLNIPAMLDANQEIRRPAAQKAAPENPSTTILHNSKKSLGELAREARRNRKGAIAVIRNIPPQEVVSWPKDPTGLEEWISRTERELSRQSARCRAAGASPTARHTYRTDTYSVDGKRVVVSGYWADPEEVESARQICSQAITTEKALNRARQDLAGMQQQPGRSVGASTLR